MADSTGNNDMDWEMSDDFYCDDREEKVMSLEDFITGDDLKQEEMSVAHNTDELLNKTAADVHRVMELALAGNNIETIAQMTGLDKQYVYDIQVCAQGFREDDEIAVAHLLLG